RAMTRFGLRLFSVALAVLALIDPAIPRSGRTRPRVSLIVQSGPSMELPVPEGFSSRRATANRASNAIRTNLAQDHAMGAGPDQTAVAVIAVGDRYPDERVRENDRVSTVSVSAPLLRNVRIAGVSAPKRVPPLTAVHLAVVLEAIGVRGETTSMAVRSGGA